MTSVADLAKRAAYMRAWNKTPAGQASKRAMRERHRQAERLRVCEYRKANRKKYLCHKKYQYAKRAGKLVPGPCEVCGAERVDGHHDDYDLPFSVRWLCRDHHAEWHRLNGEGRNA